MGDDHSGSRNVGKQMAEHYDRLARALNKQRPGSPPLEWGLAHLPTDEDVGREYLAVMDWCLRFARENRRLIAESVTTALERHVGSHVAGEPLDVHHNYAAIEEHFGKPVVVHRKGAVRATGPVAIPGSMGSASYVAEGTAHPDAFTSCSHGAGRALGRKEARRTLPRNEVMQDLSRRGIVLVTADKGAIAEEAPQAYKDIDAVMDAQRDLVVPRVRLVPLGVVKG